MKIGVFVTVEVLVAVFVNVAVACTTVMVAPFTVVGLNCTAWPLTFPSAPLTLKVYVPLALLSKVAVTL